MILNGLVFSLHTSSGYREFIRDNQSDTVYSHLEVFIPVGWDHTQSVWGLGCSLESPEQGIFEGGNHSPASCSAVARGFEEGSSFN